MPTLSRFAIRNPLTNEINVTPMIDVLLVLLITFMASLPELQKHHTVDVMLSDHDAARETDGAQSIVLEIDDRGAFRINRQLVASGALGARLRAVYAGRSNKELFVKGSRHVKYDVVLQAMDAARGAGVEVIGLP